METNEKNSGKDGDNKMSKDDPLPGLATKDVSKDEISNSDSESSDFDREFSCDVCEKSFSGIKPFKQHEKSGKHMKALKKLKLKKDIEEHEQNEDSSDEDFSLERNKIYAACDVCRKEFNGPESYRLHMRSKKHKKKVANSKLLEKFKEDGKINMDKLKEIVKADSNAPKASVGSDTSESDDDTAAGVLECETCEKVFTGLEPYRDHMTSKVHRKTLKQKKMVLDLSSFDDENTLEFADAVLSCKICRMSFTGIENAKAHLKSKRHLDLLEFRKWKKERRNSEKQDEPTASATENGDEESSKNSAANEKEDNSKNKEEEENDSQTIQARVSYKKYKEIINKSEYIE